MKSVQVFPAIVIMFVSLTACSTRLFNQAGPEVRSGKVNNYIQVKVEDKDCSTGCEIENISGLAEPVCFKKFPALTERDIVDAESINNTSGHGYIIALELNSTGRTKLYMITKENRGKRLGIYINGKFVTAPVIYSVISDGKAAIAGGFSKSQADEIVMKINAGKGK